MAQDRLAALRAQRQQNAPADRAQGTYEMGVRTQSHTNNANGATDPMADYYAEITSIQDAIQQFDTNITRISDLHSRSLNTLDESASQQNATQLEELVADTRQLSNSIKERVKSLEGYTSSGAQDAEIRKNRTKFVRSKFMEALQKYQEVERQYRAKYKQRVERQFKIVKPDATPDEVAAVVNDDQGGGSQIFAQAISSSNRYGDSRAAYREVQERHQDIRRIEQTLTELAQLFNDMATLVAEQEEELQGIHDKGETAADEIEKGLAHTETAVKHARSARRKKWICFWICVIVALAAIGIGVGVYFGPGGPGYNNSHKSQNNTNNG